jgi:hypothetical protein
LVGEAEGKDQLVELVIKDRNMLKYVVLELIGSIWLGIEKGASGCEKKANRGQRNIAFQKS